MESAETKRITNPRVEIDTSPPFESVKEAVDHFGGGGAPWIPVHLLRLPPKTDETFENMEEEALQLENDLITKEQETRNVLRELESAKRLVETLKKNLTPEFSSFLVQLPDYNDPFPFTELTHAKTNLTRTSVDDSSDWGSTSDDNPHMSVINRYLDERFGTDELNVEESFEAEQFRKLTEASRYEVMRAMSEIERTKDSIRMAEMRLNAAKKMDEAAKAVQNIIRRNGEDSSDWPKRIETFEDEEQVSVKKYVVTEETRSDNKFKFRNSYSGHHMNSTKGAYAVEEGPKTSIGDVIGRRLDARVGRRTEDRSENGRVSLSQMLREQRPRRDKPRVDANINVEKRPFFERMKFGFIQMPVVYAKQSKKKGRNFNGPGPLGAVSSV